MSAKDDELSREELLRRYANKPGGTTVAAQRRSPFKFLDSYDVEDADIFFGRDREIEELLLHFHSHGHLLIYGESGSGKSSLVQCGLRARIPDADALFIPLRVHKAGLPMLSFQICAHAFHALGEPIDIGSEVDLVATLRAVYEAASRPIVLFFDQFEELCIFHDADVRRSFAQELAAIRQARLNVKVIIGVRQDYLAQLSELEGIVEGLFDNRFWLRRMSRENAAQAVVEACRTCDVAIDDELAQTIVQRLDTTGRGIELPYLQVVMDRLYRKALDDSPEQPVITAEQVQQLGDIGKILATFLTDEVAKLPSPNTGRQILKAFVTREGTRRSLDRTAVAQEVTGFGQSIPADELNAHLDQLASVRILREIADSGTFELRHDSLAAAIFSWISEVEKELLEVRDNLVNRFKEYEARNQHDSALLDQAFFEYLAIYRKRLAPLLSKAHELYLDKSTRRLQWQRRKKQLAVGGGILTLLIVGLLGVSLYVVQVNAERARARQAESRSKRLLSASYLEKGTEELREGRYARAVSWFYAAYEHAEVDSPEKARAAALIAAWQRYLGRPLVHDEQVYAVAFSPDSSTIATASEDGTARLWDAATGLPRGEPLTHDGPVRCVAFSPDGNSVLTGSSNSVRLWDVATTSQVRELKLDDQVYAIAFSPDGQTIATGSGNMGAETGQAQIWNAETFQLVGGNMTHGGPVAGLAFNRSGEKIATASFDKTAQTWNAATGVRSGKPMQHDNEVNAVAFSPDGDQVFTASSDGTARFWDANDGTALGMLLCGGPVRAVAFSPDGKTVAAGSADRTALLRDAKHKHLLDALTHEKTVCAIAFSSDGKMIVTGSWDGTARIWDFAAATSRSQALPHQEGVNAVEFSKDAETILTGSDDHNARLWDVATRAPPTELEHDDAVYAVAFRSDGKLFATGSGKWGEQKGETRLYDVDELDRPRRLPHDAIMWAAAFSPDGETLITGGSDNQARLWDTHTGAQRPFELSHEDDVLEVAFSPDGMLILTASADNTARLWNAEDGTPRGAPLKHDGIVYAAAFSPDGRTVLTGSWDKTARLWDAETGLPIGEPMEHPHAVNAVAFSTDGSLAILSGGNRSGSPGAQNGSAWLWDVATRTPRGVLNFDGVVWTAAFHPNAKIAALGSGKTTQRDGEGGPADPRGGLARLWSFSSAASTAPEELRLAVEVLTVRRVDDRGILQRLTQAEWLDRKTELATLAE